MSFDEIRIVLAFFVVPIAWFLLLAAFTVWAARFSPQQRTLRHVTPKPKGALEEYPGALIFGGLLLVVVIVLTPRRAQSSESPCSGERTAHRRGDNVFPLALAGFLNGPMRLLKPVLLPAPQRAPVQR